MTMIHGAKMQPQCPRQNPNCGSMGMYDGSSSGGSDDDGQGGDDDEEEWVYDPAQEDPLDKCRRDPTWDNVDYNKCQRLMGWEPRDTWWRLDVGHNEYFLNGKEDDIHDCIREMFQEARKRPTEYEWARCNETKPDEWCEVATLDVMSHYRNKYEGEIVTLLDVLTEQEAYGLQALLECKHEFLPDTLPWYDDRSIGERDKYDAFGGHEVHFVQGMIQLFLPGVAASIYRAFMASFEEADWTEPGYPVPSALGMRTAEALHYKTAGQLGTHIDTDSLYAITIALSDEDDYHGGLFRLTSDYGLFKVPRLGAMVYFADAQHGVTQISFGKRNVFVAELWENDDVPIGTPRPESYEAFYEFTAKRLPVLNGVEEDYYMLEESGAASAVDKQSGEAVAAPLKFEEPEMKMPNVDTMLGATDKV
jgi:hypothetical protein